MNEKLLEKFRQKPINKKGINIIAYESIPRWDKRKLLQKYGIGADMEKRGGTGGTPPEPSTSK